MEQRPVFGIFKLKWWGQKPVTADGNDLSASKDGTRKPFGNVSLADAEDEDTISVSIMGVLDEVPRFNQAQNEARLQRVLEVATNDLLRDKVGAAERARSRRPRLAPLTLPRRRSSFQTKIPPPLWRRFHGLMQSTTRPDL